MGCPCAARFFSPACCLAGMKWLSSFSFPFFNMESYCLSFRQAKQMSAISNGVLGMDLIYASLGHPFPQVQRGCTSLLMHGLAVHSVICMASFIAFCLRSANVSASPLPCFHSAFPLIPASAGISPPHLLWGIKGCPAYLPGIGGT